MTQLSFAAPLALVATLGLTACDVAYPVAVVGGDGAVFRGTASNTFLEGGSFFTTNGPVSCRGTYSKHQDITEVSFPVRCSNGLSGVGTAFFESTTRGGGIVTMSDGSQWQFIFGKGASAI